MRRLFLYFLQRGPKVGLVLLLIALVLGGAFRFYGLDWSDKGSHHPDENQVMMQVGKLAYNDLNPHFFAYGSLPLYMYKFFNDGVRWCNKELPWTRSILSAQSYMLARGLTAFFSTLTILFVLGIGRRLYGEYVGLLAAVFFAFSVLPIKLSRFLTVDGLVAFFMMGCVYFGARMVSNGRLRDYMGAGVFYGMAMATKASAITLIAGLLTAHVMRLIRNRRPFGLKPWFGFLLLLVFAAAAFYLCMPYAIHDWEHFYPQVKYQADMVAGKTIPWYVLHFTNTTPVLYQLYNLIFWAVGPPLGLLGLAGFLFIVIACLRRWKPEHVYLLSVAVPYFIMVYIMAWVKFIRYQLPMIPLFCIMGAYLLYWLYCHFTSRTRRNLVLVVTILIIGYSLLYSFALMGIYHRVNTWEAASRWIYENIPRDTVILAQEIEAKLPIGLPGGKTSGLYNYREINVIEEPRGRHGLQQFAEKIAEVDYIILPNPGQYNLPLSAGSERFPIIVSYFQNLFGGTLGFKLVATFDSPPSLFGVTLDDSMADIGFWFFDHPKVQIFEKTETYDVEKIAALLKDPSPEIAAISREQIRKARSGETMTPSFFSRQFETKASDEPGRGLHHILTWYLTIQLLSLIGLPLALNVFKELPDRGYAMAKIIGFILVSWVNWFLVNLKVIGYNRASVLFAISLCVFFSYFYYRRNPGRFRGIFASPGFRSQILLTELIFLLGFLVFMGIKVMNPDIHGWERPSEFAYFNALHRSETLPPYDPWISGHPLNYYYYCWHMMVMLTKLLGIPTWFTYNMGVGLIAGLVGMGVFSLVYNVTRRRLYGLLGVVIFNFLGNYDALRQVVDTRRFFPFNWFQSAHSPIEYTISEFPFWSYLYGDLHPHIVVLPIILLLMTFLYRILMSHERGWARFGKGVDGGLVFFLMILTAGTISTIHLWDMPAQASITFFVFMFQFLRLNNRDRGMGITSGGKARWLKHAFVQV
ncbi:glycosyltransferase family 39 protein, partial [bacterium]|nr:glycosyltransferase family 39 protein [candidate division CSSED10-310 bacterium]